MNIHSSLQSPPAGDSQVFDVGQQKDMLRATGNIPAEHLNCRELPGSSGKAGGSGSWERLEEQDHQERLWQPQGQFTVVLHKDLLLAAARCGVTVASRFPLSQAHTNTGLLGAPEGGLTLP